MNIDSNIAISLAEASQNFPKLMETVDKEQPPILGYTLASDEEVFAVAELFLQKYHNAFKELAR